MYTHPCLLSINYRFYSISKLSHKPFVFELWPIHAFSNSNTLPIIHSIIWLTSEDLDLHNSKTASLNSLQNLSLSLNYIMHFTTIVSDDYTGNLCKGNTLSRREDRRGYSNACPQGPRNTFILLSHHIEICPTISLLHHLIPLTPQSNS